MRKMFHKKRYVSSAYVSGLSNKVFFVVFDTVT